MIDLPKMESVWRYIAICSLCIIAGLLTGQYNPNRNLVTVDQMNSALAPMQATQSNELAKIDELNNTVSDLKGQLKAQHLLTVQ